VIKVEVETVENKISHISISGDFFMYPEEAIDALERAIEGVKVQKKALLAAVRKFYSSTGTLTPMVEPEHWVEAILRAAGGGRK
jgi:lipoate-protein ligase A